MGPDVIFCDVDETLVTIRSAASFADFVANGGGLRGDGAPRDGDLASVWFESLAAEQLWVRPVANQVCAEQLDGARLVLVGDSPEACLAPIAQACSAHDVICSTVEDESSVGRFPRPLTGQAKADVVLAWCAREGVDPARCRAYGDEPDDAFMLDAVGEGVAVVRTPRMRALAEQHGWSTIEVAVPLAPAASF